jgi:hypothetical protein
MTLSTLPELQAQFVALTARIAALDRDIALETDRERRTVAQAKRDELAQERERIAADIMLAGGTPTADHVEERVTALERDVRRLWGMIKPGPRQAVARVVFFVLLGVCWSMWMIKEVRDWFIAHPLQAIAISLAMLVAALIIRWLPEDEHHDQR